MIAWIIINDPAQKALLHCICTRHLAVLGTSLHNSKCFVIRLVMKLILRRDVHGQALTHSLLVLAMSGLDHVKISETSGSGVETQAGKQIM